VRFIRMLAFAWVWFTLTAAEAQLSVPAIFSDHMVLQRTKSVPIWGHAEPNQKITISIADRHANAQSGTDGSWKASIDLSDAAAGPHTMVIEASQRIEIKDVLVGEVWLCSGQSNMSYELKQARGGAEDVKAASHPMVRLFKVEVDPSLFPASNCRGKWEVCSPDSAKDFSAIGYYFGSRLNRELNVPVGMIQAALGGTGAELWTSGEALAREPKLKPLSDWLTTIRARAKKWDVAGRHEDIKEEKWTAPDYDDSCWLEMQLPQPWPNAGFLLPPPVIYRTDVTLPNDWVGHDLKLSLGPIINWDETFVNGTRVGRTENSQNPRIYSVPAKAVNDNAWSSRCASTRV
jgi:sialate O-acetylesterase